MEFILMNPRRGKIILRASHNLSCFHPLHLMLLNTGRWQYPPFTAEENEGVTS